MQETLKPKKLNNKNTYTAYVSVIQSCIYFIEDKERGRLKAKLMNKLKVSNESINQMSIHLLYIYIYRKSNHIYL